MEIHENNVAHLKDFVILNEKWITTHFSLEKMDTELAANPGRILQDNGFIFSLCTNDEVVGVCALFNEGDGVYELARMAVSPPHQKKGYGNALMHRCLTKLRSIQAKRVYLVSNTKLMSAIVLYKKFGFVIVETRQHPHYARANIVMQKTNLYDVG